MSMYNKSMWIDHMADTRSCKRSVQVRYSRSFSKRKRRGCRDGVKKHKFNTLSLFGTNSPSNWPCLFSDYPWPDLKDNRPPTNHKKLLHKFDRLRWGALISHTEMLVSTHKLNQSYLHVHTHIYSSLELFFCSFLPLTPQEANLFSRLLNDVMRDTPERESRWQSMIFNTWSSIYVTL